MEQRLALVAQARCSVGHDAPPLGGPHCLAQIGFARKTKFAHAAFGGVERNHMVARRYAGHALAHFHHDARALMAQHRRKQALGVITGQGVCVGVAHAGVADANQHLALARRRDVDLHHLQRLLRPKGHCGA